MATSSTEPHNNKSTPTSQPQAMNVDKFIADIMADLKTNQIQLPILPQVAAKITRIAKSDNAPAKQIAQIVGADPGLSARLIQVANSPLVRGGRTIENVQMAVTRMGHDMVRNIVTAFVLKQLYSTSIEALQKRMNAIWTHSTHVAAICHALASRFGCFKPDDVMLAGLLHDIGKLPILSKAANLSSIRANVAALDMVLDRLHAPLGKAILSAWNFSSDFIKCAAEHENLSRNTERLDYCDIVLIANLHSHMGKSSAKKVNWNNIPAFKKLALDPQISISVLEDARDDIKEIQRILSA